MRLNLNETIKVKLTDLGKDIYYHKYDRINAFFGRELCKPSYPKVDDDGYTVFQLWCFIELYGEHIGMAHQNVIDPIEIVFDAPTIDPVRKGKWIYHEPFDCGHKNCNPCIECSCCGTWFGADCYAKTNYCPNCGSYNGGEHDG